VTAHAVAGRAVTGLAFRQVRRGGLVVTALAAGMSALVTATYAGTVGAGPEAASLVVLAHNPAIRTLFGAPVALDDAGGFTVWRTGTVVGVLLGLWGSLAVTRTTRGEEESGRWELLLAGRSPLPRIVVRHLAVVTAVMGVVGFAIAGAMVTAGADPEGAALHGADMALLGIFFVGVAGLTSQLFPARAQAGGAAVAVLAASLLVRMVGDGVSPLAWLRWLTPFGVVESTGPYDRNRWLPLVLLAAAASVLLVVARLVAGRRDANAGRLTPPARRPPRTALLGSIPAFAVRRTLRSLLGWSLGIGAYYFLIALMAPSLTDFLRQNPRFAELAAKAGFAGLDGTRGYAGTLFALLAIPVGVFTAVRIAAAVTAETDRRLTLLYAGPVTRWGFVGAEALAAAGGAVVLSLTAGMATWAGTTMSGAGLRLGEALAGTANALPLAGLCLGAAVFALGMLPAAVGWIGALPAAGGFLLLVVADEIGAPWLRELSPFAHLAPVPDQRPDWAGTAAMIVIGAILAAVGCYSYRRRDLSG
jgi:ABC-2 type transport system permease protein